MKKGLVMVLAVALLAVASTASAQVFGKGKTQFSFGVTQFTTHTVDTLGFTDEFLPHNNLLGGALDVKHGITDHWAVDLGGIYGFGTDKVELGSLEYKSKHSAFGVRAGLDYTENIGDMFGIYFGPGFEFVSARSKVEDNDTTTFLTSDDNPKSSTFSLDGRIGVQAKLSPKFGLNANIGQKWSYNRASFDTDLGGPSLEKVKVSRWLSSMNGFAGFVIYVN